MIDLHCDALSLAEENGSLRGLVTSRALKRGGALAQCFAVFVHPDCRNPYEAFCKEVSLYHRLLEKEKETLAPARTAEEVRENAEREKVSAILSVEGAGFLRGRARDWEELFVLGVRMASLTWNRSNRFGFPCSTDPRRDALGLTREGEEAVEEMQRLGIVVDVSHLSRGGFDRVAKLLRVPFVASHSCCHALCPHPRNLRDAQLRLLGERGGVMGLNYYAPFLRQGARIARLEDLLVHARHAVRVAGIEALALGSDFDGMDCPVEFGGWEGIFRWKEILEKEFGWEGAEKICRGNFLRLWREVESVGISIDKRKEMRYNKS